MKCGILEEVPKPVNCDLSSESSGWRVFASSLLEDWSWMLWVEWNQQIQLQEHTQYCVEKQTCRYVYVITDTGFQIQWMRVFTSSLLNTAPGFCYLHEQILLQVPKWHWVKRQTCRYIYVVTDTGFQTWWTEIKNTWMTLGLEETGLQIHLW